MSTYEPCVLGGDGRCTVWSHTHTLDGCPPEPMVPDAATRGLHPCAGCGLDLDADDVHDRCDECEPDAADVEALAVGVREREIARQIEKGGPGSTGSCDTPRTLASHVLASDWLAAHDAAAREADRAEVERLRAEREQAVAEADFHAARASALRAKHEGGSGGWWSVWHSGHCAAAQGADRERARAEAAEAALAGLVAQIQATADEYEIADSTCCNRCADAATFRRALRALIPADAATALAKVRADAKAEALREAADAVAALVPYGYGMNPDGTEDQLAMAYVEGHREAWQLLRDRAARIARQEADR